MAANPATSEEYAHYISYTVDQQRKEEVRDLLRFLEWVARHPHESDVSRLKGLVTKILD